MNQTKGVVLITGASAGVGAACAQRLARRGYRVFGTSRRAPRLALEAAAPPGAVEWLPMDVDADASVQPAVELAAARAGRIDVLVNNAGFGLAGAVEDTSVAEAQAQFETNFFGVWRVCRAVLPIMRRQRSGLIVNISSIGGRIGLPFQAAYSASKFAVEGFSEALSAEVRPFGIRVALIEPGDLATDFVARRRTADQAGHSSAYRQRFARIRAVYEASERNGLPPEHVARLLERVIAARNPRLRYTVGPRLQRAAPLLKALLPDRLFEWLLLRTLGE